MSSPSIEILCPFCRHPYPMTPTQVEVYRGRTMRCMACGRPFPVRAPAPAPEPDPLFANDPQLAGGGSSSTSNADGAKPQSFSDEPSVGAIISAHGQRAAPSFVDRAGIAAAVLCVSLVAISAMVGYAQSGGNQVIAAGPAVMIIRLAVASAGLAVMLGALSLWPTASTRQASSAERRSAASGWTAVSLGLSELVFAALLTLLTWTPMARALDQSQQAACQTRLEQLGSLLLVEAQNHPRGSFPASLTELVDQGTFPPEQIVCPQDGAATYIYSGKGFALRAGGGTRVSTHTVLAYETPGRHGSAGGIHLLFADGTVGFAEKDQASAIVSELQSGQNPPASVAALRR